MAGRGWQARHAPGALALWVVAMLASSGFAGPQLVCEQPRFDFGRGERGGWIEHTFVLLNAGDADLRIHAVEATCGCTASRLTTPTVPPGQTAEISVRLSLSGQRGSVRKRLTVTSNDPQRPRVALWLEGEVHAPVTMTPAQVFFGGVAPDHPVTRSAEIRIDASAPMQLHEAAVLPGHSGRGDEDLLPGVSVKVQSIKDAAFYRVEVSFDPRGRLGRLDAIVRLRTDDPRCSFVDLPVSAQVIGELSVVPPSIILSSRHAEPVTRQVLVIRHRIGQSPAPSFRILRVLAPGPDIRIQVQPVGRHGYSVRVSNLIADPQLQGRHLIIESDVPSMPRLRVPLRIIDPSAEAGGVIEDAGDITRAAQESVPERP